MIFGNVDIEIVELFSENLVASFSINQISKLIKKKYAYVNKRVSHLLKLGILRKRVVGSSHLCSLDLHNEKTVVLLTLVSIEKRDKFLKRRKQVQIQLEKIKQNRKEILCAVANKDRTIVVADRDQDIKGIEYMSRSDFLNFLLNDKAQVIFGFERYFEMIMEVEKELRLKEFG